MYSMRCRYQRSVSRRFDMERFGLYKPEQKFGVRCCHYLPPLPPLLLHFFANASSADTEHTNIVEIATMASIATVDLVFMSILFY